MFKIQIRNDYRSKFIPRREIRKLARETITYLVNRELKNCTGEVSLLFIDDEQMREINNEYRGLDKPTDVLSFCMDEIENDYRVLGDIIISIPTAASYAKKKNQSLQTEIKMLLVHGFLHLIGYDDEESEARKKMMHKQAKLLKEFQK